MTVHAPGSTPPGRLLRWVYRAAPEPADRESCRKSLLLHGFAAMGTLLSVVTSLAALGRGELRLAAILGVVAALSAGSIALFHVVRQFELVVGLAVLGVALLFLYLMGGGGPAGTGSVWTFILPPLAIFLLGPRWGGLVATLFVLAVAVLLLLPGDGLAPGYPPGLRPRWLAALLFVAAISLLAERSRQRTFRQLLDENRARQQTEQALILAKEQAERAARAKTEFLANMSHELRTPLNSLLGLNALLLESGLREDQQLFAERMRHSGDHLVTVINDVLDLSKIEAGELQLEHIAFEPGALTEAIATVFRADAEARALQLEVEGASAVRGPVLGDPGRIRQVLGNLLGNALKFTERGAVRIALQATPRDETHTRLRWSVTDTGIGIPADKQSDIFELFRQADGSTTRRYGGSGLGLAICRRLVAAMGGSLGVQSEEGKGSTFWFELALERSDAPAAQAPALDLPGPRGVARGLRLLAVDDDEPSRFLLQHMARRLGCALELAASGQEAIEAMAAGCFDLVLMDCHMPELDGYQTTQAIRAQERALGRPTTPIVAVTANVTAENRARCQAVGMDAVLIKPFSREDLAALLAQRFPSDDVGQGETRSG